MSTINIDTKVCIVGAGASGLIIANILLKYGIACVVIEQSSPTEIYDRADVSLIDYRSLSILHRLGLSDRLLSHGILQSKCEFITKAENLILDYALMSGGQTHYLYSQQELLADLIYQYQQAGGKILFNTQAIAIENERYGSIVECRQEQNSLKISCDFIAGCDGAAGISRDKIPQSISKPVTVDYNHAWLAVTVEGATEHTEHITYSIHPQGFAGQVPSSTDTIRYYLQIYSRDTLDDWSEDRLWSELACRLSKPDDNTIRGEIIERQILQLQSTMLKTMQHKSLFLAGDSAHVLAPAGDKALNLAIQDGDLLGTAFARYYRYQDNQSLRNYSAIRLKEVHQAQQFTESLLHTLNVQYTDSQKTTLLQHLHEFKLSQLMTSRSYGKEFSRMYVGYCSSGKLALGQNAKTSLLPEARQYKELKPLVVVK